MEEFQKKMLEKYSIEIYESCGRISYLLPYIQKLIRGRSLGTAFEKEFIQHVISENCMSQQIKSYESIKKNEIKSLFPPTSHQKSRQTAHLITDLEICIKAQKIRTYVQKVKISNLQKIANFDFLQTNGMENYGRLTKAANLIQKTSKRDSFKS